MFEFPLAIQFSTTMPYLGIYSIALIATFIISVYFIVVRFYRKQTLRMSMLICINGIACLALFGLLAKPSLQEKLPSKAILLTSGAPNALAKTSTPVFHLSEVGSLPSHSNIQSISSVEQIKQQMPNLQTLQIYGHGLYQEQVAKLDNIQLEFQPSPISPGLINVSWNKQVFLGQSVTFNAQYLAPKSPAILTANIIDLANHSVATMNILHNEAFQLVFQPKLLGHYLYNVEIRDQNQQLLTSQSIAINVNQTMPANISIIQSAPSFETKHLANWMSQYQAKVIVHTKISKNKFMTQRFNIDANDDISLSPELLKKQDMVIISGQSLLDFTPTQRLWISDAVKNGLGVLILADSKLVDYLTQDSLPILAGFSLTQTPKTAANTYPVWPQSTTVNTMADVALSRLWAHLNINQGDILVTDNQSPLNVAKPLGQGVISVSILKERFRWLTQGELSTYSHYWQYILSKVSRATEQVRFSNRQLAPPTINSFKQQVCVVTNQSDDQLIAAIEAIQHGQKNTIVFNKSLINVEQQCGIYWPESVGWHKISLISQPTDTVHSSQYIYADNKNYWQSWQQYEKVTATLRAEKQQNMLEVPVSAINKPINPQLFWWLFTLSASLLWIEQKTRSLTNKR